jgi:T-complex protein 1 subunit zeta
MSAAAAQTVNPNADVLKKGDASNMNINAARGLQDVLKSNLGPKGTLKMLVSGAGDIKLTKDGKVLLTEMQIQNPTACMIARIATAQDDTTGDGTTSAVLIVGEIMKQAERHLSDGVHPRLLCEGIEAAKGAVLQFLDSVRVAKDCTDRPLLLQIAQASLRTKMHVELADKFTEMVVDAVLCVRKPDAPIDLHMVEIMHMQHKSGMESRLVKGLVMDHGGRHPGMPKKLSKVRILTMNIDLEYQKSEVNSGFYYNSAEQREKMVAAERKWVDDRVDLVLALKKKACKEGETLLLINQKGIDPLALDMLAREGVLALRRAKRRNMERVVLACGGEAINSLDGMEPEICGYAEEVYEQTLGEETYTFVEGVANPFSCTLLIKGAHSHVIAQIKDAVRDGLRAVSNALTDGYLVPGAGGFEVMAHAALMKHKAQVKGRAKLGVQAFADALLIIPKTLAENAGYDAQDSLISMQEQHEAGSPKVGVNIHDGEPMDPAAAGIWDNYRVKHQMLDSSAIISSQLLLVDEIIRAGKQMRKG